MPAASAGRVVGIDYLRAAFSVAVVGVHLRLQIREHGQQPDFGDDHSRLRS